MFSNVYSICFDLVWRPYKIVMITMAKLSLILEILLSPVDIYIVWQRQ